MNAKMKVTYRKTDLIVKMPDSDESAIYKTAKKKAYYYVNSGNRYRLASSRSGAAQLSGDYAILAKFEII